ncbi:nicotinate-nucleotide--dimethylbenzimidazole phosphoribosyltransferase [Pragia fontium]|uniref:nicotinate-nucleotide--dimethylbenzimidazole phosphoribosyltransferase n=1 Tax=Pragia fontium TaxID=82985 RepID=UPI000F6C59A8|nr:nicotinate-nucleotide--dimethylbenzimidazole phosphoribosyltransferase [Pragia fontium]VEJ55703.1 Nicotinate-nucleotide--dimethylbenzimidazole phosphoribosyltransferase [Pragia fontium]
MSMLSQIINQIRPLDTLSMQQMTEKLDELVKPIGSLGRLEQLAIQLSGISGRTDIAYPRKQIIVMAADHGVYAEGICQAPQAVSQIQMVNMVKGKAGVNVLAKQAGAEVLLVDCGIDSAPIEGVLNHKVARGSGNIAKEAAMTRDQAVALIERSAALAMEQVNQGVDLLGVGELGMGNTTSAAAIVSVLCHADPDDAVGIGANLAPGRLQHKIDVVRRAIEINQPDAKDGIDVLAKVGGFELGGMAGVIIGAAAAGVPVVLDGFLSYAAALIAMQIAPTVHPYLIPSHCSAEKGAQLALNYLGVRPYLDMEMRLGEGSGGAMILPIIDSACMITRQMGTLSECDITLSIG